MYIAVTYDNPTTGYPTRPISCDMLNYSFKQLAEVIYAIESKRSKSIIEFGFVNLIPQYGQRWNILTPLHLGLVDKPIYQKLLQKFFNLSVNEKFYKLILKLLKSRFYAASIEISQRDLEFVVKDLDINSLYKSVKNESCKVNISAYSQDMILFDGMKLKDIDMITHVEILFESEYKFETIKINIPDYSLLFAKIENSQVTVGHFLAYLTQIALNETYLNKILYLIKKCLE